MKTTIYNFIVICCLNTGATFTVLAQPGSLDPTFGSDGKVTTSFGGNSHAYSVAIQSDSKIVAAGWSEAYQSGASSFGLVRYNTDGSLDNSFGSGGLVNTGGNSLVTGAYSIAIQSDGKILAAGFSYAGGPGPTGDFAVMRFNTDGTLDNTFGTNGVDTTDWGTDDDVAEAVAVQSDGKILAAGTNGSSFALVRYNADGSQDTGFGASGKVTTDFGYDADHAYSIAIQTDDKIVVGGRAYFNEFAIARYNSDGSLDSTFGSYGKTTTDFPSQSLCKSLHVLSDGKIVAAGLASDGYTDNFGLVRYNSDGSLDNTFGTGGIVSIDFMNHSDYGESAAIQSDGKIVVAGSSNFSGYGVALARCNTDGSLDSTFGSNGLVITNFGPSGSLAYEVAIQSDGQIVVAGEATPGNYPSFGVDRFNGGTATNIEDQSEQNAITFSPNPFTFDCVVTGTNKTES